MAETQFPIPPEEIARDRWYPTITTLQTRKNAISDEVAQTLGRKGIRQGANLKGAGSTDIPALMFGEYCAVDQVYLSIHTDGKGIVRATEIDPAKASEDLEDNEICRLWLHLMIDVATRLPLGWNHRGVRRCRSQPRAPSHGNPRQDEGEGPLSLQAGSGAPRWSASDDGGQRDGNAERDRLR
ncbi:hypothetical protein [Cereibacter sphaeroides]|uniref:hypothetical protein n=1 Tax=Cereibacter sphaeroides TaxID=1063 RepID=UPI001F3AF4CE|nr:hypothetical protein [Cereibacter sphaeroides]